MCLLNMKALGPKGFDDVQAPDIMEAIIQGTIPLDLTLTRLKKGFPLDWSAQRQDLSFTS